MLIRLLSAHEMTKHVRKIPRLNSKRLLRKVQNNVRGYFILPHPVDPASPSLAATAEFYASSENQPKKKHGQASLFCRYNLLKMQKKMEQQKQQTV